MAMGGSRGRLVGHSWGGSGGCRHTSRVMTDVLIVAAALWSVMAIFRMAIFKDNPHNVTVPACQIQL